LFVARNGTSGGRQNYLCSRCGKQFVADAARRRISPQTWAIVDTLLQAGVEVATIHKATSISKRQIYYRKSALEQKS
jgi:transposase-like protein